MDTLLLIVGVLLVAVVGRVFFDTWPSATPDEANDKHDHLMEDIARSFF